MSTSKSLELKYSPCSSTETVVYIVTLVMLLFSEKIIMNNKRDEQSCSLQNKHWGQKRTEVLKNYFYESNNNAKVDECKKIIMLNIRISASFKRNTIISGDSFQ